MGNCQAIDTATLVIQHPNGKVERLYCPVTAREVMNTNPGHYVALIVSTTVSPPNHTHQNCPVNTNTKDQNYPIRLTRIKLLKPNDTLVLGQIYRLITAQEVMKGLWAKKQAKMKKSLSESQKPTTTCRMRSDMEDYQGSKWEGEGGRRRGTSKSGTSKGRTWEPSLQSISEASS